MGKGDRTRIFNKFNQYKNSKYGEMGELRWDHQAHEIFLGSNSLTICLGGTKHRVFCENFVHVRFLLTCFCVVDFGQKIVKINIHFWEIADGIGISSEKDEVFVVFYT